jgi:hypothetical protein
MGDPQPPLKSITHVLGTCELRRPARDTDAPSPTSCPHCSAAGQAKASLSHAEVSTQKSTSVPAGLLAPSEILRVMGGGGCEDAFLPPPRVFRVPLFKGPDLRPHPLLLVSLCSEQR